MINQTQLNKFRSLIEKNKLYLDSIVPPLTIDTNMKYSFSVSMTILMEYYSLNQFDAYNSITDGDNDNKIDAFYFDDENEVWELVLIQSKYKQNDGEPDTIKLDEMKLCLESCIKILNGEVFSEINQKLEKKLNEFRKSLENSDVPTINTKIIFATNGIIHEPFKSNQIFSNCDKNNIIPNFIDATAFGNSSNIEKGELIINIKDDKDKTDSIFSFRNVDYSGNVVSCSIISLMKFYKNTGEQQLLNSNVRYLLNRSQINKEIENSFITDPEKFCFLNNGITIISSDFKILKTGLQFNKVDLTQPSIVNGGQTIATLYKLYSTDYHIYKSQFKTANVLVRIYKAPFDYAIKIAKATNSQNPINIVDLKSNDKAQNYAKEHFRKIGIGLLTKSGEDTTYYDKTITNENILQIYASLYKDEPSKAKTSKATTFKLFYDEVFNDNIDESMCKKLYRCYEVSNFINSITDKDSVVIKNAFYSLIYAMKKIDNKLLNENIPSNQTKIHLKSSFENAYNLIETIIGKKQIELKSKFSLNNLFKGSEIKALIDLSIDDE